MMKIESVNKLKILINDIGSGSKKVFYCSMAEIAETDFLVNSIIAQGVDFAKKGNLDKGVECVLNAIDNNKKISTEIISILTYMLAELNEFYLLGKLTEICNNYFKKGEFDDVPILDRPYIDIAKNIMQDRFEKMKLAYENSINNRFNDLRMFVSSIGFNKKSSNTLIKETNVIVDEIQCYLYKKDL